MSKSTKPAVAVSAKTIRTAFQSGALDPAKVVALNPKGEPKTDKDGNPVIANPACLFGGPQGTGRGRLNPAFVKAFLDANPGTTYAEKTVKDTRMVEVPMFSAKTGRPVKSLTKPISEVRKAAGVEGKKGRLSKDDLLRAAKAFGSGDPKPSAPKATAKAAKPAAKPAAKAATPSK